MPRVLVTPTVLVGQPGPYRDILESAGLDVVFPAAGAQLFEPAMLPKHLRDIDAVLASMEPFNADVLADCRLRVIARMGVGYDAIDVQAATRRGVAVTITPGTNEDSVAEHTMALLLGVMRGFPGRDQEVRNGRWRRGPLPRLAGKTIGLVGLGRIGKAVAWRARGLGLKVIACDPIPDHQYAHANSVRLVSFDELLAEADIVSLHLPCSPETVDLINADTLARMKRGAVLINTARGGLVDEAALFEALSDGRLFGTGLDVFKTEPLPVDSPLLTLGNLLLAPHMAGLDHESEVAMSSLAAQCIADLYQGRWPDGCVVNPVVRESWRW